MRKINLHIENPNETKDVTLEDELSFGRTNLSSVVLDDIGLSRLNTTVFRDGDAVFVIDENSLNGTFINGEKIGSEPRRLFDGDVIAIGSETRISVEIREESAVSRQPSAARRQNSQTANSGQRTADKGPKPKAQSPNPTGRLLSLSRPAFPLLLSSFSRWSGF